MKTVIIYIIMLILKIYKLYFVKQIKISIVHCSSYKKRANDLLIN